LFALLIGINEYADPSVNDLNRCVTDVKEMQAFLENTVCVPHKRIQVLLNQDATREKIIQHIRHLAFNPDLDIQTGNPILIFYAGHGSEAQFACNVHEKIQMLLPHNFVYQTSDDKNAQGILDVELGALLSDICAAKGDNITVILDACHSGSGTRDGIFQSDLMVRAVELPEGYRILSTIDDGVLSKRGGLLSKEAFGMA
ncbi:hypothetical protein B0H13DRAFT_1639830, partial [Mycena leptocephala]